LLASRAISDNHALALAFSHTKPGLNVILDSLFSIDPLVEIQTAVGARWETVVHGITLLGDSRLILILAVMLFWYTVRHRPFQIIAASMLGAAVGATLKLLIDHPRPAGEELILYSTSVSPSFPSGHVVLATCFWGTLAWYGWIPRWLAAVFVVLVMFSRMYLGVHFLGDVLAGALVGIVWLIVFHRWISPLLERIEPTRLTMIVAAGLVASLLVLPVTKAFPFGWEIVGGLVGAGVGLIIQHRRIRFEPAAVGLQWQIAKAAIGTAGILVVILVDRLIGPEMMVIEMIMYFAAALWAMLVAPVLFRSLGLHRDASEAEPAA
jgi:membrane-associated phospholipid phosphatase